MEYVDLSALAVLSAVPLLIGLLAATPALWAGELRAAARRLCVVLFASAVAGTLAVTGAFAVVDPRAWSAAAGTRSANLLPLQGIRAEWHNLDPSLGLLNLGGNLAMFAVIGFLATAYLPSLRRSATRTVTAGATLSAGIEIAQFAVGRAADVDDVLLNAIGTGLGWAAAIAVLGLLQLGSATWSKSSGRLSSRA